MKSCFGSSLPLLSLALLVLKIQLLAILPVTESQHLYKCIAFCNYILRKLDTKTNLTQKGPIYLLHTETLFTQKYG